MFMRLATSFPLTNFDQQAADQKAALWRAVMP
jgi:hypothetical protein